ncbi:androgen-dependent TFPI-regulating protein-like isoform X3 [Euwallacea similis]|uniref:androgen-dependent TFPI-regulating protein-like isoform X3 n=1 Tax=Euwallacea similis TaxID=1736056 RepID=UPI00344F98C0
MKSLTPLGNNKLTKIVALMPVLYLFILLYYVYSLKKSVEIRNNIDIEKLVIHLKKFAHLQDLTVEEAKKYLQRATYAKYLFFTLWTFVLQCVFLTVAIADEVSKLINFSIVQSYTEKIRHFLFSSLVFPNSLLVISVFWSIWFIDRELIFPRIIDEFYPWWLNHTLHTFIIIPLIIEVVVRFKNSNVRISRRKIAIVLIAFCSIYQTLFLTVYVVHGVWLYPIYKVLTWIQRVGFSLLQLFLGLVYQQIGLFLLEGQEKGKAKIK